MVRDAFLGTRNGKAWMSAEFDVSLRPGWFYHPGEDGRAKDPSHLMDIYFSSTSPSRIVSLREIKSEGRTIAAANRANFAASSTGSPSLSPRRMATSSAHARPRA